MIRWQNRNTKLLKLNIDLEQVDTVSCLMKAPVPGDRFFRIRFQVTQEGMRKIGFMNPSLELLKASAAVGRYQFQTKSGGDEIMSSYSGHFQTYTKEEPHRAVEKSLNCFIHLYMSQGWLKNCGTSSQSVLDRRRKQSNLRCYSSHPAKTGSIFSGPSASQHIFSAAPPSY